MSGSVLRLSFGPRAVVDETIQESLYAEVFLALADGGTLPKDLAQRLAAAAGFATSLRTSTARSMPRVCSRSRPSAKRDEVEADRFADPLHVCVLA